MLDQQVVFAEKDRNAVHGIDDVPMDGWDGYTSSRRSINRGWVYAKVLNAVVLSGRCTATVVGSDLVRKQRTRRPYN